MSENQSVKTLGIVGAGTMGKGIAIDAIVHSLSVVLVDSQQAALDKAKAEVAKGVRFAPMMKPGLSKVSKTEVQERLTLSTDLDSLGDCDFIVENVSENLTAKQSVHEALDAICPPDVCFGVNTSCLSITQIASVTKRPDKVVGIHFMNPVVLKPVVEVMQGTHTSSATLDRVKTMLAALEKEAIVVQDYPGFVSNRISHLFMNEAMWVVQDQVATPEQVDQIFKQCFGHTMGPLETADLIGLDVVRDSLKVLYDNYEDPKFRCCPLLNRKVNAGQLGRKSGEGFFTYPGE